MTSWIFLGAVAALLQPSEPLDVVAAPSTSPHDRPSNPRPQTRVPFESGQLVYIIRAWAGGATRCTARGLGAPFEVAAVDFCSSVSSLAQEGSTGDAPIVEIANVITVSLAGSAPAPLPENPGRTSFDADAEVEVAPDGSVIQCRLLRGDRSDGAAVELRPDGFCSDMLRSPPSFQPWSGEGPRRGRVRVTVFSSGAASSGQPADD